MSAAELPPVLDVCCGPRSMWFNKADERALYLDSRAEEHEKTRKAREKVTKIVIAPDMLADFTDLPFPAESFYLVVMDPPHLREKWAGWLKVEKQFDNT